VFFLTTRSNSSLVFANDEGATIPASVAGSFEFFGRGWLLFLVDLRVPVGFIHGMRYESTRGNEFNA